MSTTAFVLWGFETKIVYPFIFFPCVHHMFRFIEPSKRTAGGVRSFSHNNWYLPARPFRLRTALNAARMTNWDFFWGGGEKGVFNNVVSSQDYWATVADEWDVSTGHSWNSRTYWWVGTGVRGGNLTRVHHTVTFLVRCRNSSNWPV